MKPWPLSGDFVHFVDSVQSEEYDLFLQALEAADIVAMDAEWKPHRSDKKTTNFPRVSIMQLVFRLSTCSIDADDHETSENDMQQYDLKSSGIAGVQLVDAVDANEGNACFLFQKSTQSMSHSNRTTVSVIQTSHWNSVDGQKALDLSLSRLEKQQEVIFLLDMMLIPVTLFWEAMKKMLVSPTVLKLGFNFKQDLVNLSKSFSGPDFHSCFDKVHPYVDIGKLFLDLCGWDNSHGNRMSLASICEQVVGYTLCKDLQCSNWEQRPLSAEQQVYAAADAHCLLVIYDVLKSKGWAGHEQIGDSADVIPREGIGVILHKSPNLVFANSSGKVLHASHGVATFMVKSAADMGILPIVDVSKDAFSESHTYFIQKFSERLLVSEEMKKKSFKKRTKQVRQNRGVHLREHDLLGPPPWDPCYGGDGTPRFMCDNMVEGLAKQLRNVGFDTISFRSKSDPRKMVELAEKESRVLLTQDVNLLRRGYVPPNYAYLVKSNGKQAQLAEVVRSFNLEILEDNILSRCNKCNGKFFPDTLTPEEALATLSGGQTIPPYAIEERVLFWQCSQCMHLYWQGKQFYRALQNFQAFARKLQTSQ